MPPQENLEICTFSDRFWCDLTVSGGKTLATCDCRTFVFSKQHECRFAQRFGSLDLDELAPNSSSSSIPSTNRIQTSPRGFDPWWGRGGAGPLARVRAKSRSKVMLSP